MQDLSKEFLKFMVEFLKKHSDLKDKKIYMIGQSYAGKYLPLFTHDILEHNK